MSPERVSVGEEVEGHSMQMGQNCPGYKKSSIWIQLILVLFVLA